jgi:ABC-2 type transport system ATP-binding protein
MTDNLLEIQGVSKAYKDHQAIRDIDFRVPRGSIFGLLGPNGAGKTTLIRIINQITAPDTGQVLFDGEPLKPDHIARIGYLPEERGLYKKMKVLEQIIYFGRLKNLSKKEASARAKAWMKRFDIESWANKKVEELSKGMQQKIQFIITVLHKPDLIILDEPFSGFDPVNTELIKQEIKRLRDKGATVIFSTHRMESVDEICDYLGMIHKSQKVLEGSVHDVRNSYKKEELVVRYKGNLNGLSEAVVEELKSYADGTREVVMKVDTHRKKLIEQLNNQVDLLSFEDRLPSIHEIFISKVNED